MNRRRVGVTVVLLWLGGMGWLVGRTAVRASGPVLPGAVLAVNPGAAYHAILVDSVQVGVRSWSVDTTIDELTTQIFRLVDVPTDGRLNRTTMRVTARLTRALALRSFQTEFIGDAERWGARGDVESDASVTITLYTGADSTLTRIRTSRAVTLPSLIPITTMFRHDAAEGDTVDFGIIDPIQLTYRHARVAIGPDSTLVFPDSADFDSTSNRWVVATHDTVQATRFDVVDGGVASRLWVEQSGAVVKTEFASGAVAHRKAFELAYENFRRKPTPYDESPFTRSGMVFVGEPPTSPGSSTDRGVVLHGIRTTAYSDLGDAAVVTSVDTVTFTPADEEPTPPRRAEPRQRANAGAEPFMPIDDPRVGAVARQITNGIRDRRDWPERIQSWLQTNVRYDPSASGRTVSRALDDHRTDDRGLVAAFVALNRAVGIPARVVTGIALQDGRVYFRSWAEVLEGGWIRAPVTFAPDVNAQYVRLSIGRWARPWQVVELIGSLRPEVL